MIGATRSAVLLLLGMGSVVVFLCTPSTREPFFHDAAPSSSATRDRPRPQQSWQRFLGTAWRRLATGAQKRRTEKEPSCPAWAKETWRQPPLPSFADLVDNGEREGGSPDEAGGRIERSLARFRAAEADFRAFLERLAARGSNVSVREACATACGKTIEACKKPFDYVVLNAFPNSGCTWTGHMFTKGVGLSFGRYQEFRKPIQSGQLWKRKLTGTEASLVKSHGVATRYGLKGTARTPAESSVARVIHLYRAGLNNIAANFRYLHFKGFLPLVEGEVDVVRVTRFLELAYKLASHQVHWHCKTLMITPFIPTNIVNYNDMLGDPEEAFRKMFNFVGNEWTEANLSATLHGNNAPNKPPEPLLDEGFWTEEALEEVVRIYVEEVRKFIARPELCLEKIRPHKTWFHVATEKR